MTLKTTRADKPKRRRKSAEETRRQLLTVAADELVRTGGALEMAELAKRAGLSEGLAYHYFGNRAGVIAAVVDAYFDRYEDAVIDLNFEGATWQEREQKRVIELVRFYCDEPLTPVIFSRLGSETEVMTVETRRSERIIDLAAANISRAQEAGDIPRTRDPRILGAMMMGAIRWAIVAVWPSDGNLPSKDELVTEIWAGIEALSHARSKR